MPIGVSCAIEMPFYFISGHHENRGPPSSFRAIGTSKLATVKQTMYSIFFVSDSRPHGIRSAGIAKLPKRGLCLSLVSVAPVDLFSVPVSLASFHQ